MNERFGREQKRAVEQFVSLCTLSKTSRVHISQGAWTIEDTILDPRASEAIDTMSVTKAITGLVVGIWLAEKDLCADMSLKEVAPALPHFLGAVSIRDILHHTSGLRLATDDEVGHVYQVRYSNLAVNLINPLVQQSCHQSLEAYAQRVLFSPLEISDVLWEGDASGHQYVMAGLHLRLHDLVKIGNLLFSAGCHRGRQVVPREWVEACWRPTAVVHDDAIGGRVSWSNLWAQTYVVAPAVDSLGRPDRPPDSLSASGFGGQFIVLLRRSRLLVVTQRDMELDDSRPHLGGETFSQRLDELDRAFAAADSHARAP